MARGEKITGLQIMLEAGFMQIDCNRSGKFYMINDITVKFIMTLLNQTIFPIFSCLCSVSLNNFTNLFRFLLFTPKS